MEEILRRYPRSLSNLFLYTDVCDMTLCFDKSGREPVPIFEKIDGEEFKLTDPKFAWLCAENEAEVVTG